MALDRDDFAAFMAALADPGVFGTETDLAETLATDFGDLQWASRDGFAEVYADVLDRRFGVRTVPNTLMAHTAIAMRSCQARRVSTGV